MSFKVPFALSSVSKLLVTHISPVSIILPRVSILKTRAVFVKLLCTFIFLSNLFFFWRAMRLYLHFVHLKVTLSHRQIYLKSMTSIERNLSGGWNKKYTISAILVREGNKAETKSTCLASHSVFALAKSLTSKIPNFELILTWNQPALSLLMRCKQKQRSNLWSMAKLKGSKKQRKDPIWRH